jgi:endonuclease-8
MPEGDTIAWAASRIRPVLAGRVPDEILTPQARHAMDRWPERLAGRAVHSVDTHGKHLFIRFGPLAVQARHDRADRMSSGCFEGALTLHSHLGMTGRWLVSVARRPWRQAWIVLRVGDRWVVELGGPVLELMTDARLRLDQRLARLGPDVLAEQFDAERYLARLHADDPTRPFGDALLDQRNVAGIGNIWKAEGCWEAAIDPWRALTTITDAEALAVIQAARHRMQVSAADGPRTIKPRVYGRLGQPCPRCGGRVRGQGQGDANRTTYWCPQCQR